MLISVNEGSTARYSTTLLKDSGAPVTSAELTTLTLTLYDKNTGNILNGRDAVNVKNVAGGTFHATTGAFEMLFNALDNAVVGAPPNTPLIERHIALFEATWDSNGALNWEVEIDVRHLNLVP